MTTGIDNRFTPEFLSSLTYQTPFFLFDRMKLTYRYNEFRHLFPNSSIHYAMKANSEMEILRLLSDLGCGFEVASRFELNMLKEIKVSPGKIIYGTSIKPIAHIKEFVKYGVDRFALDSFQELEKIAAVAPNSRVYVRTVVNDAGSVFKFSEKFGADRKDIVPLLLRAKELGLKPYGISFHVGSQATNVNAWANALVSLNSIMGELKEKGIVLEMLNLGGGYPCKYVSSDNIPTLHEIAAHTLEKYKNLPDQPKLLLEPGRGMVSDTGVLVASIIARIERRGNIWLFLDAGVYNALFEAMAYQGSTRYPIISLRKVGDAGETMFALAGPTGDSPDVITHEALLPQDMVVGDKLIFLNVGAYSLTTSNRFNGFPKPAVYYM